MNLSPEISVTNLVCKMGQGQEGVNISWATEVGKSNMECS